jgi:hypothetical protein
MRRSLALMFCLSLPPSVIQAMPDPTGQWSSELDGLVLSISADGTFDITPPDRRELTGSWWIETDSGLYVFANHAESDVCPGVEGRYRLLTDGSQGVLRFQMVDDSCIPRIRHMELDFVRVD